MAAKQNKLSVAEQIQKKAITKQVVGGVNTNISLTKTEKEFYQRFVNLSVNEMPLPQGDGMIRISPFDDYFLFTLYDEVDGEDTPIDLSNVGTLYLNFIGVLFNMECCASTIFVTFQLSLPKLWPLTL